MTTASHPVLHHVNLQTSRLEEMIAWYGNAVGLEVVFRFAGGAWLTNDGANHRLALLTSPALADDEERRAHCGLHHIAFEYPTLDELLSEYVRLGRDGVRPHFTVDHGMTTSFYYLDPDDNSVELQVDNFGDWEASMAFMRDSPHFAADPIGAPVDPDAMIAKRTAGVSAAELHRLAYGGKLAPERPMDPRLPLARRPPQPSPQQPTEPPT